MTAVRYNAQIFEKGINTQGNCTQTTYIMIITTDCNMDDWTSK